MSKAIEQRVKQRLKEVHKVTGIPFNSLLTNLFLERFLVRVGSSKYGENLIFKGGMCLSQYIELRRGTKDLDFLLKNIKTNIPEIMRIITEISTIDVKDGCSFSDIAVSELSIEHKKYPGHRIELIVILGQIKNKVHIDIGVGDVVRPRLLDIELMRSDKPIFEESIGLQSYPLEYIFAEKVEAILYFGELNSRMKDYYDCFNILEIENIKRNELMSALTDTCENRGTVLRTIQSPGERLIKNWEAFARREEIGELSLEQIIKKINDLMIA